MIIEAIEAIEKKRGSDLFIDLMTYQDLENMRGKTESSKKIDPVSVLGRKRYVILTLKSDSGKVHYPLPLNYVDNPDVETLKAI